MQDPHSFLTCASRNKPASAQRADPEAGRLEGQVVSPRSERERTFSINQAGWKCFVLPPGHQANVPSFSVVPACAGLRTEPLPHPL